MGIKGHDYSSTFVMGHLEFKIKTCLSQKLFGHLKSNSYDSFLEYGNVILKIRVGSHMKLGV